VPFAVEGDHRAHVCAAWWYRTGLRCDPEAIIFRDAELTFVRRLNTIRAQGGWCGGVWQPPAPPVAWSWALQEAARDQVQDQIARGYSGHTSPSGRTARDWARDRGYPWWVRDNLASGYPSEDDVIAAWLADGPHCEPLFDPETQRAAGYREGNRWALLMGWDGWGVLRCEVLSARGEPRA
jgi:uncharacterized protein YkwD